MTVTNVSLVPFISAGRYFGKQRQILAILREWRTPRHEEFGGPDALDVVQQLRPNSQTYSE